MEIEDSISSASMQAESSIQPLLAANPSIEMMRRRRPADMLPKNAVAWIVDELQRIGIDPVWWAESLNSRYGAKMDLLDPWTFLVPDESQKQVDTIVQALGCCSIALSFEPPPDQIDHTNLCRRNARYQLPCAEAIAATLLPDAGPLRSPEICFYPFSAVSFLPSEIQRHSYKVRDTLRRELRPTPNAAFASYFRLLWRYPPDYPVIGTYPGVDPEWKRDAIDVPRDRFNRRQPAEGRMPVKGRARLNLLIQGLLDASPFNVPTPTGQDADDEVQGFFDPRAMIVIEEWKWRRGEEWMEKILVDLIIGRIGVADLEGKPPAA